MVAGATGLAELEKSEETVWPRFLLAFDELVPDLVRCESIIALPEGSRASRRGLRPSLKRFPINASAPSSMATTRRPIFSSRSSPRVPPYPSIFSGLALGLGCGMSHTTSRTLLKWTL